MDNLIQVQFDIEKKAAEFAKERQEKNFNKEIKNNREYNLNYGKKALELIDAAAYEICVSKFASAPPNSIFFHQVIKPQILRAEADAAAKVHKFKREWNPIKDVPELIAATLVSNLSKEPTLNNVISAVASNAMHKFSIDFEERDYWKEKAVQFFGDFLEEIANKTGIYELNRENCREYRMRLTEEWAEIIKENSKQFNFASPNFKPSVTPPNNHTSLTDKRGGYLFTPSPLLKAPVKFEEETKTARGKTVISKYVAHAISNFNAENNPEWFAVVNRMQSTPYCVNVKLLDVINRYRELGLSFGKFPYAVDNKMVERDADKSIEARNEKRAKYNTKPLLASSVRTIHNTFRNKAEEDVRKTDELLDMAKFYADFERIYYPLFTDYRGRFYPYANTGLTFQGDEMAKALIHFANKEYVTDEGVEVLFENLGNCINSISNKIHNRIKLKDTRTWFKENLSTFEAGDFSMFFIDSHKSDDDKTKVFDEPITALGIVLEIMEILKDRNYKSGIIVHRDARCSGASIIGTLMRDESVMEMTSVIDWFDENGKLGDAYTAAAMEAKRICEEEAHKGNIICVELMEMEKKLFSRSSFKNVVMTRCSYGATSYGMRKKNREMHDWEGWGFTNKHIEMFNVIMDEAVKNAIPACSEYLVQAQAAAKHQVNQIVDETTGAKKGYTEFVNPVSKFPVIHREFVEKPRSINTTINGRRVGITLWTTKDEVDTRGMCNAFAPNLIHSLDSALIYLVRQAVDFDMAMIHDSIGSHPNNTRQVVESYSDSINLYSQHDLLNMVFEDMGVDARLDLKGRTINPVIATHCLV